MRRDLSCLSGAETIFTVRPSIWTLSGAARHIGLSGSFQTFDMSTANFDQITAAQRGMQEAIDELESLKEKIGMSKQIVEFCTDRRKTALSVLVVQYSLPKVSTVLAEHQARADKRFAEEMKTIMRETAAAESVIKAFEIGKIKFECARSILSSERSLLELR